jgi:hypothetical protein
VSDDAKRAILARRARFVAAALAGVSACDPKPSEPQVCLSQIYIPEADADAPTVADAGARIEGDAGEEPPRPCLSPLPPPRDEDAGAAEPPRPCLSVVYVPPDAGARARRDAGVVKPPPPRPTVCLSPVRKPQVCLSVAPPSPSAPGEPDEP